MSGTLRFAIFVAMLAGLLYLGNAVVAAAILTIFGLELSSYGLMLHSGLALFSLSFIASSMLGNRYYNWFTRGYYYLSSLWVGLLVYLFIASVVYGVAVFIASDPLPTFGALCLLVGCLVTLYGVVHARKIMVKEVTVTLPNLPQAWRGRRLAWTSDIHLGQIYSAAYTRRIVSLINGTKPDLVVVGGDLFDGTKAPDLPAFAAPFKELAAPLGSYFISGNHEEFGDNSPFLSAVQSAGLRTLMDEKIEIDGVQLIGVDYAHSSKEEQFTTILTSLALDHTRPSILLKHEPLHNEVAQTAGVSLQISGHTHDGQFWPFGYMASSVHKGFSYGLKRLKDLQVFTSSGTGTWGPPLRVGTDCEIVVFIFA